MNKNIYKGDRVIITHGPYKKIGQIGIVEIVVKNGAILKMPDGNFTPIRDIHYEKIQRLSTGM